jgi:hypothetical protein
MDHGSDWGQMFITRDAICDGTQWHQRLNPADPAHDPYFPINQAALTLVPEGATIQVGVKTMTPNFKTFLARVDGAEWKPVADHFTWTPHAGANRLEVKSVNQFGVDGPVSTAEIRCD